MANRKITLKDSTGTDNLYPATFTSQVFNEDGENVDTLLNGVKQLFYKVITGTTTSTGYVDTGVRSNVATLISAMKLGGDNGRVAIPYRMNTDANSQQYLLILDSTGSPVKNTSITCVAIFAVGLEELV